MRSDKVYRIDTRHQCYKTPYFCFSYIFSVFPYFILRRSKDPFSVLQKYGGNVCITEIWSFLTLTPKSEFLKYFFIHSYKRCAPQLDLYGSKNPDFFEIGLKLRLLMNLNLYSFFFEINDPSQLQLFR